MATPTYTLRLPEELREALQAMADKERRSIANMMVVLLEQAIGTKGKRK